jgi:hypothetical protein
MIVAIERPNAPRHRRVSRSQAEFILGPLVAEPDEFDAGIGIEIDEIAIRRGISRAPNTPIPRSSSAPTR